MSMNTTAPNISLAFLMTLLAGLATGIGSFAALAGKGENKTFLSCAMGFSAGVMIYISLVELLGIADKGLSTLYGARTGAALAAGAFFAGMIVIGVIDRLVPDYENPHETHDEADFSSPQVQNSLMKMGLLSAAAIAIHNFPEGFATFAAALADPKLGLSTTVAIAIHNIPEGIAVSVPIYYATKSRKKAFWLSFLSGLAEPLGAAIGYLFLRGSMTPLTLGLSFGFIAGIMVFISFDEMLPAAHKYGKHHTALYSLAAGMFVMAASLILFK